MPIPRSVKYLWAGPTTLLGLIVAALTALTRGRCEVREGILAVSGGFARRFLGGGDIGRPLLRTFGHDIARQRSPAQRFERELERIKRGVPGIVVAVEIKRPTEQAEDILHADEMTHLLLGDAENDLLPALHVGAVRRRDLRAAQRIGGKKILHHQ